MSDHEQQQLVDEWGPIPPEDDEPATSAIPFVTDDEIARRIKQAENGVADLEYRAGVLKRELADLRAKIEPRETT